MNFFRKLAVTAAFTLFAASAAQAGETINGAGASFPYPVYLAWGFDYNKETAIRFNYQSIGSGGGQQQIISRTVDFGASDAPMEPEKLKEAGLIQFPAVVGGVVLGINLAGVNNAELKLDSATVCKIFLGEIKNWNDPSIKALNEGLTLPNQGITAVYRSDGSGTTSIFTTYLSNSCPSWKAKVGAGKAVKWPLGIGGKGNEGVASYVKRVNGSIGYIEFAYAKQNKINYTQMKNDAGNFVAPSSESFQAAAATGNFDPAQDFNHWLTNAPGANAWPIAGATFILLAKDQPNSNKQAVKFFNWAFDNGDATAERLIYVPLPASLKEKIRAYWKTNGIQ